MNEPAPEAVGVDETVERTRRRLLDAAQRIIEQTWWPVCRSTRTMTRSEGQAASRSTMYRAWTNRDQFEADVMCDLAGPPGRGRRHSMKRRSALPRQSWPSASPELPRRGRDRVLRETVRRAAKPELGGGHCFAAVAATWPLAATAGAATRHAGNRPLPFRSRNQLSDSHGRVLRLDVEDSWSTPPVIPPWALSVSRRLALPSWREWVGRLPRRTTQRGHHRRRTGWSGAMEPCCVGLLPGCQPVHGTGRPTTSARR